MATYEEQLRKAKSRPIVLWAIVLWIFALVSGFLPAILAALIGFLTIDFVLDAFLDLSSDYQYGANIGFRLVMCLVLFGYPLALLLADRVGPWMIDASSPDRENPDHVELVKTTRLISLAAGVRPILFVTEGDWVNGASLGKRGKRPVVVVSEGTARAPKAVRELVLASVLSESMGGAGASRVWLATRAPALWPLAIGRWLWHRPTIFAVVAGVYTAAALVQFGAGGLIFMCLFMPVLTAMFGSVIVLWLAGLSAGSRILASASHSNADLGAMALLRQPQLWVDAFGQVAASPTVPNFYARLSMEWVLPTTERAANKRRERLLRKLPAMQHSVGQPAPNSQAA